MSLTQKQYDWVLADQRETSVFFPRITENVSMDKTKSKVWNSACIDAVYVCLQPHILDYCQTSRVKFARLSTPFQQKNIQFFVKHVFDEKDIW